jgi:hypothetical protein
VRFHGRLLRYAELDRLVNLDLAAIPLDEYLSDTPAHFRQWDYENRYKAAHVGVVVKANWKVAAEAFLETWHVLATLGSLSSEPKISRAAATSLFKN